MLLIYDWWLTYAYWTFRDTLGNCARTVENRRGYGEGSHQTACRGRVKVWETRPPEAETYCSELLCFDLILRWSFDLGCELAVFFTPKTLYVFVHRSLLSNVIRMVWCLLVVLEDVCQCSEASIRWRSNIRLHISNQNFRSCKGRNWRHFLRNKWLYWR